MQSVAFAPRHGIAGSIHIAHFPFTLNCCVSCSDKGGGWRAGMTGPSPPQAFWGRPRYPLGDLFVRPSFRNLIVLEG